MPKGIKKERSKPRAIPPSQSVLYRTIKKALPEGLSFRGTLYSHRDLLVLLRANADARAASDKTTGEERAPFPWAGNDVMDFHWREAAPETADLWSEVYSRVSRYKREPIERKAAKKGDK